MKIRIKALINAEGKYCAYGYNEATSRDLDDTIYEVVHGTSVKEYWITVELSLPEAEEIEATASESGAA